MACVDVQIDPLASAVAVVAIGIAIWANAISHQASSSARRSADEAKRSADAAEAANQLAARERARALEVVDVAWDIEKPTPEGVIVIRNIGTTTAYSVTAVVRVGVERFDVTPGDLPSDADFEIDAAELYERKRQSNRAAVASMAASGIAYAPSSGLPIEARVSWQSAEGTPGVAIVTNKK